MNNIEKAKVFIWDLVKGEEWISLSALQNSIKEAGFDKEVLDHALAQLGEEGKIVRQVRDVESQKAVVLRKRWKKDVQLLRKLCPEKTEAEIRTAADMRQVARWEYPKNLKDLHARMQKACDDGQFSFPLAWLGHIKKRDADFFRDKLEWDKTLLRQAYYEGILETFLQINKYAFNSPEATTTIEAIKKALDAWEQRGLSKVRLFMLCANAWIHKRYNAERIARRHAGDKAFGKVKKGADEEIKVLTKLVETANLRDHLDKYASGYETYEGRLNENISKGLKFKDLDKPLQHVISVIEDAIKEVGEIHQAEIHHHNQWPKELGDNPDGIYLSLAGISDLLQKRIRGHVQEACKMLKMWGVIEDIKKTSSRYTTWSDRYAKKKYS